MSNLTISEVEKARKILSHCEEKQCTGIARMEAELETEAEFWQAVERQCRECQEDGEMKDGETRMSCLEAENEMLRQQIAALKDEVRALKAAWYEERREWRRP